MKEYIAMLLCVCGVCGFAEMLTPGTEVTRKHVKLLCSLCVLCVVAAPLGSFIAQMKNGGFDFDFKYEEKKEEYSEVFYEHLDSHNASVIAESLEGMVCEHFDIEPSDIDVRVYLSTISESSSIESVSVIIYPAAISKDPHLISEYIVNVGGAECEIIYG